MSIVSLAPTSWLGLVLLLSLPSAGAALPEPAVPWLKKMASAHATQNYDGEMVYLRDGRMTTLGIVNRIGPNGTEQRLFALDGEPREVVRDINRLSCKLSPGRALEIPLGSNPGNRKQLADSLAALGDYYQISLQGRERIANRDTQRIDLMPMGQSRYGHRLWLDTQTGLPLKTQLVDPQGAVLEEVMFTEISYQQAHAANNGLSEGPSADHQSTSSGKPQDPETAAFNPSSWAVEKLPQGFHLTNHRRLNNGTKTSEHLVFSDGMATVSVFIEDLEPDSAFNGISRRGTVTLYGRTYGDRQVTVIGEVPETTVRSIGDGLRNNDQTQ